MKRISACLLVLCIVFNSCFVFASYADDEQITEVEVYWNDTYLSINEMFEASDLVIIGTVKTQSVSTDGLYSYTKNDIQIDEVLKGEKPLELFIHQLGGDTPFRSFPYPDSFPKMIVGSTYILFLELCRGGYCVLGGYQGVIEYNLEKGNDIKAYDFNCIETKGPSTPANGWNFTDPGTYYFYISTSGSYNTTARRSYLRTGIQSWNGLSGLSLSETSIEALAQIIVYIEDSWPGDLSTTISEESLFGNIIAVSYRNTAGKRKISILPDNMSSSIRNNSTTWIKLGCHETGHVIGLGHNTTTYSSAMRPSLSAQSVSPENPDITTLTYLYGN